MVNIKDVVGDCNCFKQTFKEDVIESLDDMIAYESVMLTKLDKETPEFDYILQRQSRNEELLKHIRPVPVCKKSK